MQINIEYSKRKGVLEIQYMVKPSLIYVMHLLVFWDTIYVPDKKTYYTVNV